MAIVDLTNRDNVNELTEKTSSGVVDNLAFTPYNEDVFWQQNMARSKSSDPTLSLAYRTNTYVPENYGASKYDSSIPTFAIDANGYSLDNLRAEQQSGLEQLGFGIAKGLGLAGTTFVNSTLGAIWGLGSAANGGSYYDNEFMDWTNSVNEWFEEALPNYYTKEQEESAWYSPTNLISANFWGDKFIKNLGFTAGAAAAGGVFAGGLGAITTALNIGSKASAITKGIGGVLLSSAGESSTEAYNTKHDFMQAKQMDLENKFFEDMQAIDAQYGNTEMGQKLKAARRNNYDLASNSLEEAATNAGNMDWLLNMAILMPSNLIQFGKVFGGKNFTMAKKVARGELGQLKNPIGRGVIGTAIKNANAEGVEEVLQEVASRSSGFANEQGIYDLYELGQNNTSRNRAEEIVSGIGRGLVDALGEGSTWEQYFIGTLTGALGSAGETVTQFKERKDYQKDIEYANSRINSGTLKEEWQNLVRQQGTQSDMETAATSGDEASYKNAKHANIVSDIITYDRLGRLEDYKSFIKSSQEHLSDEDIESIIQNTGQNSPYVDENGNPKAFDEVRNIIKSKTDDTMKMVNTYQSVKDDIIKNSSRQLTNEELQNVLWYKMAWDNKQNRVEKMGEELKDYFKEALINSDVQFANLTNRRKLSSIDGKLKSKQKSLDKLIEEGKGESKAAKKLQDTVKNLNVERNNIKIVESPQSEKIKSLDEQIRNKVKQRESILGGDKTLDTDSDVAEINKEIEGLTKEQQETRKEQKIIDTNINTVNKILNMQGGLSMLNILNNENLYNYLYEVIESDKNTDSDTKASLMNKLNDIIDLNDQQNSIKETVDKILTNPDYLPNHKVKIDAKYKTEREQQQIDIIKEKILAANTFTELNEIDKNTPSEIYNPAVSQLNKSKETPAETKTLLKNYNDFKDLTEQIISISNNLQAAGTLNTEDLESVMASINDLIGVAFRDSLEAEFIETQLNELQKTLTGNQQKIVDDILEGLKINKQAQPQEEIEPDFMTATPEKDDDTVKEDFIKNKKEEKKVYDASNLAPDEYEEDLVKKPSSLYKGILDGTVEITGNTSQEQVDLIKRIAYKFSLDDGREKGNPIQNKPDRYDTKDDAEAMGNSERTNSAEANMPNLRSWLYTKWRIDTSKATPQSGKGQRKAELFMPDGLTQPQEVVDLDRLGAFDFVEKGYLADLYNAFKKEGKQLPIKLLQLGNTTQQYQSLISRTLLAVEMEGTYNSMFADKGFQSIEVNGVQYQIVGILGANREGENILQQISNTVSNTHTNKEENYVYNVDMNIGHFYTGRMVLTNEQFPNLEERELHEILNGENPLFAMYYTDSDIKQPFGGKLYGEVVKLNTHNGNNRDGSLWLLTKEADGRYYYKAIQVARYNDWFNKHSKDTDNPILNQLKKQFEILCDKTKSETQRASAKGIIEDIIYFPESRLNFDVNSSVIKFHGNPLNTEGSPEDMVEQCLNSLTNYNLHFQIRPHHLSTLRKEIIQSGLITTNLAQLHNVNASFDLVIPQIEEGKIVIPKQPNARVVGHTGNSLNYQQSQKSQVSIGSNSYYIDNNTLVVTTKDGASVNEDTASEIVLRHKIGNKTGLFESSYNSGKKFYIRVTSDNVEIIREGTEAYNKLQEKNKKEEAKQNANNIAQQSSKKEDKSDIFSGGVDMSDEELDDILGSIPGNYDAELAEVNNAFDSQQQTSESQQQATTKAQRESNLLSGKISNTQSTTNEAMSKLKSDIQDYKEQQKKKEVGSDRQETSMGNKNTTMSIAEQAINSFNKVSRKKEIREILSSNNIKNIDSFMDYCIQNDKDVSTAILNADNLKSWIEKNIVCKQ